MISINTYLNPTYSFNNQDYEKLKKLVEEFPWYGAAHQALAKAAQQLEKENQLPLLNKAALFANNREALFDYYIAQTGHKTPTTSQPANVSPASLAADKEKSLGKTTTDAPKEKTKPIAAKAPEAKPSPAETSKDKPLSAESPKASIDSSIETKKPTEATQIQAPKPIETDDGKEIETKEDLRDIVKKELERIDKERAKRKEEALKKESTAKSLKKTDEVKDKKDGDKTPLEKTSTTKASEKENKSSFAVASGEDKPSSAEASGGDKSTFAEASEDKRSKSELLDHFIKTEPSISKPAEDASEDTLRLAKESLEDHFDFVSETLAEIYYKQNNPKKAVKVYEQLIVKLPEKKLYFAARIKEIIENK